MRPPAIQPAATHSRVSCDRRTSCGAPIRPAGARVRDLPPESAAVFTSSSETLRVSGIEDDLNAALRRLEAYALPANDLYHLTSAHPGARRTAVV